MNAEEKSGFGQLLGANLVTVVLLVGAVFVLGPQIDRYLKTLVPPNITVTPSEVDVVMPEFDFEKIHLSKHLKNLTYFELSTLVDSEFTAFMRMYNHHTQKPSPELKDAIVEQASRINKVMAFREEAWLMENRELGDRQNDFTPLKPILNDVLESLGVTVNGNSDSKNGSGESPE